MSESEHIDERFDAEAGLDDHSEELSERSEADAQIRFYRAMAETGVDYDQLLDKLARAVAEVIFDFCIVYLIDGDDERLESAAAYHPHPKTLQQLHRAFGDDEPKSGYELVNRVVSRRQNYFRPRWRPSLLQAYNAETDAQPLGGLAIHSLMVVPMITTEGACLGALLVGRHSTTLSYDDADLALTEWIASHAAMKLETAQLYRDLRETNRRLDAAVDARDTFISIASHQLRTPLSTLKIHAEMLRRTARDAPDELTPGEVLPKLDSIDHQVDYLDRLVDQLLNVSRIVDGGLDVDWERCNLTSIVDEVVERFSHDAKKAGSTVRVSCEDRLVGTWDRERLDHVLTNLLSNAIKYGCGNPIRIDAEQCDDTVVVTVADNGTGIPGDAQTKIFERFERAVDDDRRQGLGLGLWIVREYVESLDGEITVDSRVDEGSTFTVELPVEPSG